MPLKVANFRISAPNRGVNYNDLDVNIDDKEASDIQDMQYTSYGPRTRAGYSKRGTTSSGTKGQGGSGYYKNGGSREEIRVNNKQLEKYDTASDTWLAVTKDTGAGLTVEALAWLKQAENVLWVQNGTDALQYYNQTKLYLQTGGQIGNGLEFHKNRLWTWSGSRIYFSQITRTALATLTVTGATNATPIVITTSAVHNLVTGNKVTITGVTGNTAANGTWHVNVLTTTTFELAGSVGNGAYGAGGTVSKESELGNYTSITGNAASSGYVDINKDDGADITIARVIGNRFIIFKETSTWELVLSTAPTTDADIVSELKNVTFSTGCIAADSAQMVEDDLVYLSARGVFRVGQLPQFLDSLRTTELSFPIRPKLQNIAAGYGFQASAAYDRQRYILSITPAGQTQNTETYVYYLDFRAWSRWTIGAARWWQYASSSASLPDLHFSGTTDGYTYRYDIGLTDNGAAISSYVQLKNFSLGAHEITKFYDWLDFLFLNTTATLTCELVIDGSVRTFTIGLGTVEADGFGTQTIGEESVFGGDSTEATTSTSYETYIQRRHIMYGTQGRFLRPKLSNSNLGEEFALMEISGRVKALPPQFYPASKLV